MVTNVSELSSKIRKICFATSGGMHPRKFVRRYKGLENFNQFGHYKFSEMQIREIENDRGYRQQAINLLSEVLRLKTDTLNKWGQGSEFAKIPITKQAHYEASLLYFDTIRVLTANLEYLPSEILLKILQDLKSRY